MALLYIMGLFNLVAIFVVRICIGSTAVDGGSFLREVHAAPVPAEPGSRSFPSGRLTPVVIKALIESCLLH